MMRRGYKFVKEGSHNYEHEHDPDTVRLLGAKAERGKSPSKTLMDTSVSASDECALGKEKNQKTTKQTEK